MFGAALFFQRLPDSQQTVKLNRSGICGGPAQGIGRAYRQRLEDEIARRMVAAGRAHSLALTTDGRVFAWGRNSEGQLGIGTLAFALAAQDTVKNLFGSITIFLDKPFQIGDWVVTSGVEGTGVFMSDWISLAGSARL